MAAPPLARAVGDRPRRAPEARHWVVTRCFREPVPEGAAQVVRPECAELAFAAGDLGVVEAADLADDGVDRSWREPSARAGADRAGGQEQGVAVVVGIAGSFRFEVVSDGVACVAAEEDCAAGAALAPDIVQPGLLHPLEFVWLAGVQLGQVQAGDFGAAQPGAEDEVHDGPVPQGPGRAGVDLPEPP